MAAVEIVEVFVTPHDDLSAFLIETTEVQNLVAVVLEASIETEPRVGSAEVDVLTDSRTQHRVTTFHLIAVVVLHIVTQRVITGAVNALGVTELQAPLVLLPACRYIREYVIVSAARLWLNIAPDAI